MSLRTLCGSASFLTAVALWAQTPAPPGLEAQMRQQGLVDIQRLDGSIRVELKYSSVDNFMGADVYGDLERCYLQRAAAEKLVRAQALLKERYPSWSLKVFDGARPRRVQWIMWRLVEGTEQQKYVASPGRGSIHNYGSAVDLTICDAQGEDLDMGTPYDFLGELAQPRFEAFYLKAGKLTQRQVGHRELLRNTMLAAGFSPVSNEWWHFDAFSRSVVTERYKILE